MATLFVNIDVPDLERGIEFYTRAFELRLARRLGDDYAELLGGQAPVYLLQQRAETLPFHRASAPRAYSRHWTPVHLDFVVQDISSALARALDAGAVQESEIGEHAYGKLVLLADPFGHGVCLLELNEMGYDAIATGEQAS